MLYWIIQPGSNVGGIGAGLVRMVRSWHEWLIVWGYDISQPPPDVDAEKATEIVRNLLGMPGLDVEITGTGLWGNNEARGDRRAHGQHRARESEARSQSCSRSPPSPSGWSSLGSGPATKPSSEIEM